MPRHENITRGAGLMVLASLFFCVGGCLVKYGSWMGVYKLAFFRFAIGLALIAAAAASGRIKLAFVNKKLLLLRGLAGGTAICIAFVSIARLGLGKGMVLMCSYPVFASIIGAAVFAEPLTWYHLLGSVLVIGSCAVVLARNRQVV